METKCHPQLAVSMAIALMLSAVILIGGAHADDPSTPITALIHALKDEDAQVRAELARKIARLAPNLSADQRDQLEELTIEALDILGRDALPQIRQIIAEEIKRLRNLLHQHMKSTGDPQLAAFEKL